MYEVELKVRANHEQVRERLAALCGDHVGSVTQVDTYYNAPDRDFAATDEALRVRREIAHGDQHDRDDSDSDASGAEPGSTERVLLAYKGPLVDDSSKTRTEAETRVVDGEALRTILAGLGYEPAATVRKERDQYTVADCRVTLDRVERLGDFVEVEYHDTVTEADIDHARQTVADLLVELGLDPDDSIQTSYLGLLLAESS